MAPVRVPVFGPELDGEKVEDLANLFGFFTILAIAAWRNIVVPRVRDEHYELSVRRKAAGSVQSVWPVAETWRSSSTCPGYSLSAAKKKLNGKRAATRRHCVACTGLARSRSSSRKGSAAPLTRKRLRDRSGYRLRTGRRSCTRTGAEEPRKNAKPRSHRPRCLSKSGAAGTRSTC